MLKVSKRMQHLFMVQPGLRDSGVISDTGSAAQGLSLDYSAISRAEGTNVPYNYVDDYLLTYYWIYAWNNDKTIEETISTNSIDELKKAVSKLKKANQVDHIVIIWGDKNGPDLKRGLIGKYKFKKENKSDDVDLYTDNENARGSFVGGSEAGFPIRHNMDYGMSQANTKFRLSKISWPDFPAYSGGENSLYNLTVEGPNHYFTPQFDLFNTYWCDNGEYNSKAVPLGDCFRYAVWFAKDNGGTLVHASVFDPLIKKRFAHSWVEKDSNVYDWQTNAKKAKPLSIDEFYKTYKPKNIKRYTPEEGLVNILKTNHYGPWEDEELKEKKASIKKQAFIKTALSYDSHPIIQELIKVPQIKSLIEQQAAGLVDKIIVITPSADVQQTQQQLNSQNPGQKIELQPITKSPFGHMWMAEDPISHQKKPLDRIVRIDKVVDHWQTLITMLHEILHHKFPNWSESQVETEAEKLAGTVKQFVQGIKNASKRKEVLFVRNNLSSLPLVTCSVASDIQSQIIGLQNHSSLRSDSGMLFTYSSPQSLNFWMGSVKFPIDIIFLDNANTIKKIYHNCKPNSQEIYSCADAHKVIEVVGNFCTYHNLNPGDRVFLADDKPNGQHSFVEHVFKLVQKAKLEEQELLNMEDWNIQLMLKNHPGANKFLKVDWDKDDYKNKKAFLVINPNLELIKEALRGTNLNKVVRRALIHILAGVKYELPEEKMEQNFVNKSK